MSEDHSSITTAAEPGMEVYQGIISPEVQESDGNFFETFTALAWKQENRRRRTSNEEEKESDKPPPSEFHHGPRPKVHHLHRKEFELLYIEVLYTIKHKIGTTTSGHSPFIQDLYHYAREAFGVTQDEHVRLLARASEEKPPILVLNATVVEARNLEAKDADGFSDPYCMLGIIPGRELMNEQSRSDYGSGSEDERDRPRRGDRASALKKFSQSFKRRPRDKTARDVIPARFIRTTTVKPNTLNPIWNEKFRFDLEDIHSDRVHLDIWDHDDEFSVVDAAKRLNEVQTLKGLGRYFKQIAQSARTSSKGNVDDFLGSVNISLEDIPSTGCDRWYDLEGRSSKSNIEGRIHMRLSLSTREDRGMSEEDNWTDIKQHEDLMCIFIDHELRKYRQDDKYLWTGELPQPALTILHQHAIQGDITEVQEAMCRWAAYSRKHREHPFSWEFLLRLLTRLSNIWEPASLSRDEEEILAESFANFIDFCIGLLRSQRVIYPPANIAAQRRLEYMIRCLVKMYDMPVFKHICPFQKDLYMELASVFKKSSIEWYERMRSLTRPPSNNDEDVVRSLIDLTNMLNTDMQKAIQFYNPMYENIANVSYFNIVYRQLEKLIHQDAKVGLEEELGEDMQKDFSTLHIKMPDIDESAAVAITAQELGTHLFELYLAVQEFCRFSEHLTSSERRQLSVTQFYGWFKPPLTRWIKIAKFKVMNRIQKSVELDKDLNRVLSKVGQVEGDVKQSTSAVDVCCCFGQVIEFWRHLEWPDPAGSLPIVTRITEDICEGATYYADLIHQKLKQAGYYDDVGQFDVTEQLCITINDIEQVRRALKPLPEALRYAEIVRALERDRGERSAKEAKISLYSIIRCADEDMTRKMKTVVDRVADKMRPDIKKYVFHLCWSPESVPAEKGISELMNYLDNNLVTLNTNLLRTNFDRILDSIWVEVLEEIRDVIVKEEAVRESKTIAFFERLYEGLEILVDFFHANEKGLPMSCIRSKLYEELYIQLSLNKASTKELIETYYIEKLDEQEKAESMEFGTLSVRVYYNRDVDILLVEVLNAKNIIPLDPNVPVIWPGLSDPFVLIELCPNHVFPRQTIQQTKIIKNTLNPVFDESFEFEVSQEQCQKEGACILFTVMDHDFMVTNDFAGECYLSLNNIPGISGEDISGFSALTPVTFILTQPRRGKVGKIDKAKGALAALQFRDWDKEAQDFVKKRRQIESQSQ